MRVGFNAHFFQHPMTGSGQYARNLLAALLELDGADEYLLISPLSASTKPTGVGPGVTSIHAATPFDRFNRHLAKIWFEQFAVPRIGRNECVDILHYPYFAAPLMGGRQVVVTIHDIIPLLLGPYRGTSTVRLYSHLVSAAARRATAIITDSESSKADIVRLLRIPPERITVIYLAVDAALDEGEDPDAVARVRRRYALPDEFILYMGGLDHRKNVIALVEAFAEARKQLPPGLRLAIAGQMPGVSPLFPDVKAAVRRLGIEDAVSFLGPIADEDRPSLYRAASVFVYPSLYEGFGLPPLEAMACGTPVICSNSSSLPEVVGDAGLLFSPADRAEITRALVRVSSDEELRCELQRRGIERARRFSWRKAAQETVEVYRSVMVRCKSKDNLHPNPFIGGSRG